MYALLNKIPSWLNRANERRVINMLKDSTMPAFVRGVHRADGLLNTGGVDLVVKTDRQDILLQIKPNYYWAHVLKKYVQYTPLAIIVCDDSTSDDHLRMRLLEGLEYGYNRS